jgi:hypothetical protein
MVQKKQVLVEEREIREKCRKEQGWGQWWRGKGRTAGQKKKEWVRCPGNI